MNPIAADAAEAASVVAEYFEACRTGDADHLAALFHPAAQMFGRVGRTEFAGPITAFLEHVRTSPAPAAAEAPYEAHVRQAQVVGDTAVVTLEERGYQGRNYVDQFSLCRSEGRWVIVAKLFAVVN